MYNVKISKIEIHEKYIDRYKINYDYDFAIISLDCDLKFDYRVAPVCLGQFSDPSAYENRNAVAIGWGSVKCWNSTPFKLQVMTYECMLYIFFNPNSTGGEGKIRPLL